MDSSTDKFNIELMDQEHDPATSRFLGSLGFGESVLQDLGDSEQSERAASPMENESDVESSVVLSSQMDDIALPDSKIFSESAPVRRGGLQDIARSRKVIKEALPTDKALPVEAENDVSDEQGVSIGVSSDSPSETSLEDKVYFDELPILVQDDTVDSVSFSKSAKAEEADTPEEIDSLPELESSEQYELFAKLDSPKAEETTEVKSKNEQLPVKKVSSKIVSVEWNGKKESSLPCLEDKPKVEDKPKETEEVPPTDVVISDQKIESVEVSDVSSESNPEIVEEPVKDLAPEPVTLSCPKCSKELTLEREFLGVEGACVWCETAIVAAQSGSDGTVRAFVLESENPIVTIYGEVVQEESNASHDSYKEEVFVDTCDVKFPGVESIVSVGRSLDLPELQESVEENATGELEPIEEDQIVSSDGEPEVDVLEETPVLLRAIAPMESVSDANVGDQLPEISGFEPLLAGGFADLPIKDSLPDADIEIDAEVLNDKALDSLDSADTTMDSAWSNLSKPMEKPDEPEIEKLGESLEKLEKPACALAFNQLGQEALMAETSSGSPFPEKSETITFSEPEENIFEEMEQQSSSSSPFLNPVVKQDSSESQDSSSVTPWGETTNEGGVSDSPILDSDVPVGIETVTAPTTNSNQSPALAVASTKENLPDDIVQFLTSLEEQDEPPTAEEEVDPINEAEEIEPVVEEQEPVLTKRQLKKARKKEGALTKEMPGTNGPLSMPAPAPRKSAEKSELKLKGKTKAGSILIAGLVVGIGIASFFVPVQAYVEKARSVMTEAFKKQIGLEKAEGQVPIKIGNTKS